MALESRALLAVGTLTQQIMVDQFGYRADSGARFAIFADPQAGQNSANRYTPGNTFQLRRTTDDAVAFTGSVVAWKNGATHDQSQDKVWWGDFSSFNTPGEYYVFDTTRQVRSFSFSIDNRVYEPVLRAAVKTFYYQRSAMDITAEFGGNWTHPASHVGPNQDRAAQLWQNGAAAGSPRDVSGGWYDAGDYNRYVVFTTNVLWDLLTAYEWRPEAFGDSTNIPESANGTPDLLDEVRYETDWLLKMQRNDGGVFNRVTNRSYNVGASPELDTQARYYTPVTTWATASFAASTAHAARVFSTVDPAYSQTLRDASVRAWQFLNNNPNMTPASGSDGAQMAAADASSNTGQDRRLRVLAAVQLWRATGDSTYRAYFEANYNSAATVENGHHPVLNNRFDPTLGKELNRSLVSYVEGNGPNTTIVNQTKSAIRAMANNLILAYANQNLDAYRSYMWDGHYSWGSNSTKSEWANILLYARRLNVTPANNAAYTKVAGDYLNYLHGRNPLSQSYLSNMGDKPVMELYHGWVPNGSALFDGVNSQFGPMPGYLVGGANQFFSAAFVTPPSGQPIQKSFRDFNNSWNAQQQANEASWEVNEPAIYYQAAYVLLMSNFVDLPAASAAPGTVNIAAISDTGASNVDGITRLNNQEIGSRLNVTVTGVVANAWVELFAGQQLIGRARSSSGGTFIVQTDGATRLNDGGYSLAARQMIFGGRWSELSTPQPIVIDTIVPTVSENDFERAVFVFEFGNNESRATRFESSAIQVFDRTRNQAVGVANYSVATVGNAVKVSSQILPDGDYRLSWSSNAVTDLAGNWVPAGSKDFHVLGGDANRDRKVDFSDLVILARNFNQSSRVYSQGDFNYDNTVNFSDLVILARNFNQSLLLAPVATPVTARRPPGRSGSKSILE